MPPDPAAAGRPVRAPAALLAAPPPGETARRYVLAGVVWAAVAAGLATVVTLDLAFRLPQPIAALGVGRLHLAYVYVVLWGALSLPIAGALLAVVNGLVDGGVGSTRRSVGGTTDEPWAWRALMVWNLGLVLGLLTIVAGQASPAPWAPAPWWALACVTAGIALWAWAVWRAVAMPDRSAAALGTLAAAGPAATAGPASTAGPPAAAWLALPACLAAVAMAALGTAASAALTGAPQALAGAIHARGAMGMWLALGGLAVAVSALPIDARRPLYSRRALWWGLWAWLLLQPLAAARDLSPDALPAWLVRPVDAATVALVAPAALLTLAVLGTYVGRPARRPHDPAAQALAAGVLGVTAGVLAEAALVVGGRSLAQFTAWDTSVGLLPPLGALTLLSLGAAYVAVGPPPRGWTVPPKWHLALVASAALAAAAVAWPVGLAEAAGVADGLTLRAWAVLRLPAVLLAAAAAAVAIANFRPSLARAERKSARTTAPNEVGVEPSGPAPLALVGTTATVLAVGLFVVVFLPMADPGVRVPGARAVFRDLAPYGLAAAGRAIYIADGCAACHTQRVRDLAADRTLGPATRPADYGSAPALLGIRRVGPDLAWIGDRSATADDALERLAAHGADGAGPHLRVVGDAEPGSGGLAIAEYLAQLRSHGSGEP